MFFLKIENPNKQNFLFLGKKGIQITKQYLLMIINTIKNMVLSLLNLSNSDILAYFSGKWAKKNVTGPFSVTSER